MVWQVTYCFSYGGKRVVFVEADSSELAWAKSKFQLTPKEQRSISRSGIKQVEEG